MCSEEPAKRADRSGGSAPSLCVTNIQRFSLHDGAGIRTVVFCKGCPFRCPWCCNPEDLSDEPQISFNSRLCIGCTARAGGRLAANGCPCATAPSDCPTGAKELAGTVREVSDLVEEIMRDLVFYEESGGGLTVSGGEALARPSRQRVVTELLRRCRRRGISCVVESSLATPLADPEALAQACDALLVDFKIADRRRSRSITGIDPVVRDANVSRLIALGTPIVARMPIVPGYTNDLANVRANALRARALGIRYADILPFHQLGEGKYDALGLPYACRGVLQPTESEVADALRACSDAGLLATVRDEVRADHGDR